MGADGTVGANHEAVRIIAEQPGVYAQAYFSFDAHKSGGVTVSHLRFGPSPINSAYLISEVGAALMADRSEIYARSAVAADSRGCREHTCVFLSIVSPADCHV